MKLMILKNNESLCIDKNKETFEDILKKYQEESIELKEALQSGDDLQIAEETLDVIQICIGILDKLNSKEINVGQLVKRHNKKLVMRNWKEKGVIQIRWRINA